MRINGFSLLELSIVIVIVGLIAGGIMQGRHLIRAAELKSLTTGASQVRDAVGLFQEKYGYLPGDMPNATTIWGAADGGDGLGADCTTVASVNGTTATCNGNGDGRILYGNYNAQALAQTYEAFRAYQHLANAGIYPGAFTGIPYTPSITAREAVPGVNVPAAKMSNVGFTLFWYPSGTATWFPREEQHVVVVGGHTVAETRQPMLSAMEMLSIDEKFDDGKPATGVIQTWRNNTFPNCVSSDDPLTAVYLSTVQDKEDQCSFYMQIGY